MTENRSPRTRDGASPRDDDARLAAVAELLAVIDRLRAEGGCPWDREQKLADVGPHLVEEAAEVQEALAAARRDDAVEEFGDVLMNVLLAARIGQDAGDFDLADVASRVAAKLVRRHPHVFGDVEVKDSAEVLRNWDAIKASEHGAARTSALDGVPTALPALTRAAKLVGKAEAEGFAWPDARAAFGKVEEEVRELDRALVAGDAQAIDDEIGDVALALAALARRVKVDPEAAARRAAQRFEARFRRLEEEIVAGGETLAALPLERLLSAWGVAKRSLEAEADPLTVAPAPWPAVGRALRAARRRLESRVRDVPPDLFTRQPRIEVAGWSVRDVLLHLLDVEERIAALLERFLRGCEREPAPPFPKGGLTEPPARLITPPQGRIEGPPPKARDDLRSSSALLEAIGGARRVTTERFAALTAYHPRHLVAPHPTFGPIDVLQWGEFTALHEERHVAQIERILTDLRTSGGRAG
jgi:ATP diphosphatase